MLLVTALCYYLFVKVKQGILSYSSKLLCVFYHFCLLVHKVYFPISTACLNFASRRSDQPHLGTGKHHFLHLIGIVCCATCGRKRRFLERDVCRTSVTSALIPRVEYSSTNSRTQCFILQLVGYVVWNLFEVVK